jgi:hypothetical protein
MAEQQDLGFWNTINIHFLSDSGTLGTLGKCIEISVINQ